MAWATWTCDIPRPRNIIPAKAGTSECSPSFPRKRGTSDSSPSSPAQAGNRRRFHRHPRASGEPAAQEVAAKKARLRPGFFMGASGSAQATRAARRSVGRTAKLPPPTANRQAAEGKPQKRTSAPADGGVAWHRLQYAASRRQRVRLRRIAIVTACGASPLSQLAAHRHCHSPRRLTTPLEQRPGRGHEITTGVAPWQPDRHQKRLFMSPLSSTF